MSIDSSIQPVKTAMLHNILPLAMLWQAALLQERVLPLQGTAFYLCLSVLYCEVIHTLTTAWQVGQVVETLRACTHQAFPVTPDVVKAYESAEPFDLHGESPHCSLHESFFSCCCLSLHGSHAGPLHSLGQVGHGSGFGCSVQLLIHLLEDAVSVNAVFEINICWA